MVLIAENPLMDPTDHVKDMELPEKEARERLLSAAAELFAQGGFAGTNVRDITNAANCNIAAVNYHFGGKEKLYIAVFHGQLAVLRERRIRGIRSVLEEHGPDATVEMLVRSFAQAFLEPLQDESQGRRLMTLMMRELLDPILPKGMIYQQMIGPVTAVFAETLETICPELDDDVVLRCNLSLVGQLLLTVQVRNLFAGLGDIDHPIVDLPRMVEHIVGFTTAGIEACRKKEKPC